MRFSLFPCGWLARLYPQTGASLHQRPPLGQFTVFAALPVEEIAGPYFWVFGGGVSFSGVLSTALRFIEIVLHSILV